STSAPAALASMGTYNGSISWYHTIGCEYNTSGNLLSTSATNNYLIRAIGGTYSILGNSNGAQAIGTLLDSHMISLFQINANGATVTFPQNQVVLGTGGFDISLTTPGDTGSAHIPTVGSTNYFFALSSVNSATAPAFTTVSATQATNQLVLGTTNTV